MKTKCLISILLVLFLISFTACNDDNKRHDMYLPQTAHAFIESRLPGYDILDVEEVDDLGNESNEKYIVTLSKDITITFSSLGYWRRIESTSELPEKVQDELSYDGAKKVKAKYPSKTIKKMYFLPYFYKVVLNDDTSLIVYTDNGSDMKVGMDIYSSLMMYKDIYEFVKLFYSQPGMPGRKYEFFQEDEIDGSNYRFYVNDGASAYFDKDGNWYYVDGGGNSIYKKMYQYILPQELRDIIENKYKHTDSSVLRIVHHDTYYQVVLKMATTGSSTFSILYDTTTQSEVEPPVDTVLDFLKTYVGEPDPDMTLTSVLIPNGIKKVIYEFTGSVNNTKIMVLSFGIDGRMHSIALSGKEIPRKILDYLPEKVKEYIEENIPSTDIIVSVVNGMNNEYYIQFKNSGRLSYDKDSGLR